MYWPIGAPRIFTASSSKTRNRVVESDDDAESRETTEGSGSLLEAPSTVSGGRSDDGVDQPSGTSTPMSPVTAGSKPIEQQDTQSTLSARLLGHDLSALSAASGPADREALLGLKVSRTGHLFTVISSTSLTIWQTKVCTPDCGYNIANRSSPLPYWLWLSDPANLSVPMGQMLLYSSGPILQSLLSKQLKAISSHIPWLPTQTVAYTDPTLRILPVARLGGIVILEQQEVKGETGFSGAPGRVEEFGK
jgi:hypothetical protein